MAQLVIMFLVKEMFAAKKCGSAACGTEQRPWSLQTFDATPLSITGFDSWIALHGMLCKAKAVRKKTPATSNNHLCV